MYELKIDKLKEQLDKRSERFKGNHIIENGCLNGIYEKSEINETEEYLVVYYGMSKPIIIYEKDLCSKKIWSKFFAKYKCTEFYFAR